MAVAQNSTDFQDRNTTINKTNSARVTSQTFAILETSIPEYARKVTTWPNCYWDFTISDAWHLQTAGWTDNAWEKGGIFYAPLTNLVSKKLNDPFFQMTDEIMGVKNDNTGKLLGIQSKVNIGQTICWTPFGALKQQSLDAARKANGQSKFPLNGGNALNTPTFLDALRIILELIFSSKEQKVLITYIDCPTNLFSVNDKVTGEGADTTTAWYVRPDSVTSNWLKDITVWYIDGPTEVTGEEIRYRVKEVGMPFIQIDLDEHAMGFRYPKQARPEGTVGISFLESHDWIIHDLLVYWKSLLFESGSRTFGNVMNAGMYGLLRIYIPFWDGTFVNPDNTVGATRYYIKKIYYWNLMCVDISEIKFSYEDGDGQMIEAEFSVEWITSSNTRLDMAKEKIKDLGVTSNNLSRLADLDALTRSIQDAKAVYLADLEKNKDAVWNQTGQAFKSLQVENPDSDNILGKDSPQPDTEIVSLV